MTGGEEEIMGGNWVELSGGAVLEINWVCWGTGMWEEEMWEEGGGAGEGITVCMGTTCLVPLPARKLVLLAGRVRR